MIVDEGTHQVNYFRIGMVFSVPAWKSLFAKRGFSHELLGEQKSSVKRFTVVRFSCFAPLWNSMVEIPLQ